MKDRRDMPNAYHMFDSQSPRTCDQSLSYSFHILQGLNAPNRGRSFFFDALVVLRKFLTHNFIVLRDGTESRGLKPNFKRNARIVRT